MNTLITQVRKELKQNSDAKTRESFQRFFKEEVKFHGTKSAAVSKIARENFKKIKDNNKEQIFAWCEELLQSGYCEEAWVAANWAYSLRKKYTPGDFAVFENWIDKYIDNWAECDTLCNHSLGAFIEMYPEYLEKLKNLTRSRNRWMKRAAAVSLIVRARAGKYLEDVFEIVDRLLTDTDYMVQKGYGWLLKEASKQNQQQVFAYVMKNKDVMPRTALRYAIEKMSKDLRQQAMAK